MESTKALAFQSPPSLSQGETVAPCPHFQHRTSFLESFSPHDHEVEFASTLGIAKQLLSSLKEMFDMFDFYCEFFTNPLIKGHVFI